ncbi:hypothetical protein [Psychrobacillus sp. MER TA 171]|uniref:hypothetical protein n=1 Tax=Psychrobacillus sp. MER TA 171 TaxID=2939577 RepID=UPI00182A21B5|nr:hypothetical protein [Psychrobacillus sp. MER TA 171]NME05411.1 hypothetical protein [Psychrobacillus sp. BL-248-WT-3]
MNKYFDEEVIGIIKGLYKYVLSSYYIKTKNLLEDSRRFLSKMMNFTGWKQMFYLCLMEVLDEEWC